MKKRQKMMNLIKKLYDWINFKLDGINLASHEISRKWEKLDRKLKSISALSSVYAFFKLVLFIFVILPLIILIPILIYGLGAIAFKINFFVGILYLIVIFWLIGRKGIPRGSDNFPNNKN